MAAVAPQTPQKFALALDAQEFARQGYAIQDNFLTPQECTKLLALIADYRRGHEVPEIYRPNAERNLHYKVIDGLKIKAHLPAVAQLYQDLNAVVNVAAGRKLVPLQNEQVGVNVNITPAGGAYRWHYDRNQVTAILYLNSVAGGETECYPHYRLLLGRFRYSKLQKVLDYLLQLKGLRTLLGKPVLLAPRNGTLLLMRADKCLHSVRPVLGTTERINIILAYDAPDAAFAIEKELGNYLYNQDARADSDPNYQ